jgi:hypothetical protein
MARSALTGTEKKVKKAALKSAKEREGVALGAYKKGIKSLEEIQQGKGALPSDQKDIQERYARALKESKNMFKDQKANAIAEYQQTYAPQVRGAYGAASGQGSRSSVLNQALAAAQGNLSRGLNADYETLRNNVANNILNTTMGNKLSNLNANLSASSGLTNQGVNPVSGGLAQQASYMPSSGQPSNFRKFMAAGSTVAGGVAGGVATGGNPAGIAAGIQGGNAIGQLWL